MKRKEKIFINKLNEVKELMGINNLNENEYYYDKGKIPKDWNVTSSAQTFDDDTYHEPLEDDPKSTWNSSVTGKHTEKGDPKDYRFADTNNSKTEPNLKPQTYDFKSPINRVEPKPINRIEPNNNLAIKGVDTLTKPGDINSIIKLMEYNQLGILFETYSINFNDDKLITEHNRFSKIMFKEIVKSINEIKLRAKTENSRTKAIGNSANSKFFKNLLSILPSEAITANISHEFERQYGKRLNKIEVQKFLKELLSGLSGLSNSQMAELIKKGGLKPKEYSKIIHSLYDAETIEPTNTNHEPSEFSDTEDEDNWFFTPETVANYSLRNVNEEARKALTVKAALILKRNNMELTQENMLEAMRQLIDDINKSGIKKIPTISMDNLSYNK